MSGHDVERTALAFSIAGRPVPKGRPRFDPRTRRAFTPRTTRDYEKRVGESASLALALTRQRATWPKGARYLVTIIASYPDGRAWADADNIAKAILDGCNRILWDDDRQVDLRGVTRRIDEECPRVDVIVEVDPTAAPRGRARPSVCVWCAEEGVDPGRPIHNACEADARSALAVGGRMLSRKKRAELERALADG